MKLSKLTENKWRLLAIGIIGIFILIIISGYMTAQKVIVPITDEEQELAVEIAREALGDRINEDFTPTTRDSAVNIKYDALSSTNIVMVNFYSEGHNSSYRVVVDMNMGQAVQIIENRGWMKSQRMAPPPGGPFMPWGKKHKR